MPHIMKFFEKEALAAYDLDGRDVTVTIESVGRVELPAQQGKKAAKKPMLKFVGEKKTLVCNITNARAIMAMYGPDPKDWKGKRITLYGTTTQFGRDTVECIRVRPRIPGEKATTPIEQPQSEEEEVSDANESVE